MWHSACCAAGQSHRNNTEISVPAVPIQAPHQVQMLLTPITAEVTSPWADARQALT